MSFTSYDLLGGQYLKGWHCRSSLSPLFALPPLNYQQKRRKKKKKKYKIKEQQEESEVLLSLHCCSFTSSFRMNLACIIVLVLFHLVEIVHAQLIKSSILLELIIWKIFSFHHDGEPIVCTSQMIVFYCKEGEEF